MRWDIFCRVVDNFGDIGVCWRLAAQLAGAGQSVRLWVDDPRPLAWMAPRGASGVEVIGWTTPAPDLEPGEAVIEAFGCDPPPAFVARMAASSRPPFWINFEYLSAESYVERSHGLPSPQHDGPGRGLVKRFFYPGFGSDTGGLLREPALMAERQAFGRDAWLRSHGWTRRRDERVVVLFCYPSAPVEMLLSELSTAPTLLLVAASVANTGPSSGALRAIKLPWLEQPEFDRLLWSADLNFVRGEDSFVRAQWAGAPFVWQIYPQHDAAHRDKLRAYLDRLLIDASPALAAQVRALHDAWNSGGPWPRPWPDPAPWQALCRLWRDKLLAQTDLCTRLLRFVAEAR
jgi:uncharacterized repeat protein (TIGR03837 family)